MGTKISIQIGVMSAPARILTAVRDDGEEAELRTVCVGKKPKEGEEGPDTTHSAARVNSFYQCPSCARKEKSYHPFPRGLDNGDGTYTVIARETGGVDKTITDTLSFLPTPRLKFEAQAIPSGKFYYVGPGAQPQFYALIRDLMRDTSPDFAWVTAWAYRTAPNIVRAEFVGDLLAIQQYAWPQAIVAPPQLDLPSYNPQLLEMAKAMLPDLVVEFDANTFVDTRKTKLAELIAKATKVEPGDADSTAVDASQALLLSMQEFVAKRAENVGATEQTAPKRVRKAAPKKAPAKAAGTPPRKRTTRKPATQKEVA